MNFGEVEVRIEGANVLTRPTGEIDLSNARSIEEAICVATPNEATAVILDLSELDYIDSAGIQLIYHLRQKLHVRGQELQLVVPGHSPAADALRLAGVSEDLGVAETTVEGLGVAETT